jgi:hypothetical protein
MSARSMLARVRRLETGNKSPILKVIGTVEAFEEHTIALVASGHVCPLDGPFLVKCVRKWVSGGVYVAGSAGNARG